MNGLYVMFDGFKHRWTLVSDYAAQLADGKYVFSGVYTEALLMEDAEPEFLQPLNIALCFATTVKSFSMQAVLQSPTGEKVTGLVFEASARLVPIDLDRFVVVLPSPRVEFPGFGEYTVAVGIDESQLEVVHRFSVLNGEAYDEMRELLPSPT